jgi:hypothetical protein
LVFPFLSKIESRFGEVSSVHLSHHRRKKDRKIVHEEALVCVGDGKIYLGHEGHFTDWMKNTAKNSKVRVRIGSDNFEASGKILGKADKVPKELGMKTLYEKYYDSASKKTIDDWFELSTVVELTPLSLVSGLCSKNAVIIIYFGDCYA